MPVDWSPHRFAGGALALDTANTVVLRIDESRSFDRFSDPAEIRHFAAAACKVRPDEFGGRGLDVTDCERAAPIVVALREAIDALFRNAVQDDAVRAGDLARLMGAGAAALASSNSNAHAWSIAHPAPTDVDTAPIAFEQALAVSALTLLPMLADGRIRICDHCGWLFADRSRNRSRRWCDMTVCGNRTKARRHYRRAKAAGEASA